MKQTLILLVLLLTAYAHIYSSPPKVTYNYAGLPLSYSLYMSLERGLGASDYLKLVFNQALHTSAKTEVVVNLISFSNNLVVATATCVAADGAASNILHVSLGYALAPNSWYQVQVFPSPTVTLIAPGTSFLVQVFAVSSFATNFITYDSNLAFGYINVIAPSLGTLGVIGNSSSSQATVPAAIYSYDIYVTPVQGSTTGGNFTLQIYYNALQPLQATGTTINDFTFMGLCQSAATQLSAAVVLNYCTISSDLSTITFSLNSVTAGQAIRISTSVSNPVYSSVRGIKGYWTQFISGKVLQNGFSNNCLQVSKININTVTPRVQLFWGIDYNYVDSTITSFLPIFKAAIPSPSIFQYNSFNIGFSFTATSPITGLYKVQITINAQGVLQASIAHNFPAYSGTQVYCYYTSPNIICNNVGAFINTGYRYFISGKAFFSSGTASTISFGDIAITPIVYDSSGILIASPILYNPLTGVNIAVQVSQEFLDTGGYHSTSSFQIGNSQVVSYADDLTLSSTANAIQGFLQGTNSTVGIVPGLGTSQQLLFLLKTPTASISSGAVVSSSFTTQLMFNNAVISFQSSAAGRGLDFVGYGTALSVWSITTSPCYFSTIICQKYNNNTVATNTKILVNTGGTSNFYGMYNFQCGASVVTPSPACASNCANECTMFTGYSLSNTGTSLMAMRQVVFPSGYQTPIYADSNLLDFLFIFSHSTTVVSYCLINGYTLTGSDMQNIKAAYVNYFDNTAGAYNKGSRIPMMLRIGGGVLPAESIGATAIGIFFDDYVDATTFYTTRGSSWAVGCSTGSCNYFPNTGLSNVKMDNWLTSRSIQVYNLPPIQNQFNILIPVAPDATNRNPPRIITLVFFSQNYTFSTISGLLQTLSVYRLFGPVTTGSVTGAIPTVNSLARNGGGTGATPTMQMVDDNFVTFGGFSVSLNTTNMYSSPTNNTFTYGNTDNSNAFGTTFGAGYTITSFYYNIFASSTLQWNQVPSNTASTCTTFGYVYNQILGNAANAYKNKQWFYLAFCPIDSSLNLQSSNANIDFLNPQYPSFLTKGFDLRSILTYAYSNQAGYLRAYNRQRNPIPTSFVRTCTTAKLQTYNPSSNGKQRSTFTLTTPSITLGSSTAFIGYISFRIVFDIPSGTVGSSGLSFASNCDTSLSFVSCSIPSASPTQVTVLITYTGTGTSTATITYMQVNLYATANGAFGTAAAYTVTLILPQYYSASTSDYVPFGNSYASASTYCSCTSSFTVGITGYGQVMNLNTLALSTVTKTARSKISFAFGASSYRDAFFSTSTWRFDFGCLTNPNSGTYFTGRSNFRCMIFEGTNSSSMSLSSSWTSISLTSFSTVTVIPKAEISNPSSILYNMVCYGGAAPDGTNSNAVTGTWQDGGAAVQTATGATYASLNLGAAHVNTATIAITRRFSTSGFKSFYSFQITCTASLSSNAIFYIDFHMSLSSYLDNEGVVQCYLRPTTATADNLASFTYCSFVNPWQLMVWSNQALTSPTPLVIDVFNVDQPKTTDVSGAGNSKIAITIDNDGVYSNGVIATAEAGDSQPPASAAANLVIKSVTVDNFYILSTQTITISIDTLVTTLFSSANKIYVLFPASYSQWITRGQVLSISDTTAVYCQFKGSGANLATACSFISRRILKINVAAAAGQNIFTLKLMNIMTPASVPIGKFNQYRFKIFVSDGSQSAITYYSFTDYSQHLTLTTNPSLISLSWNYYSLSVSDTLFSLASLTNQVITIQQGYYSNIIELRQSIYPNNFYASLVLALSNAYAANYFSFLGGSLSTVLGKPVTYFRMAGGAAPAGLYTLIFSKIGDTNNQYTNIPPLSLVVKNTLCALSTDSLTYTLPIGGSTLPIIINAINCIPTDNITISLTFSGTGFGQFSVSADLSSRTLKSSSLDGQIYIIVKHTQASLTAGSSVTATFTITGTNSAYYTIIPPVTLTLVDATTFQTYPTATALSTPTLSANTATVQLQCSQASLIFWGIGVYPSILNFQAVDFEARIISGGNGLQTNFTQSNDYFQKVYGIRQGTTMQVISKTLYNLQSNVNYLFKYFCMNQLGHISDSQSISFTSANYGAYLMKVQVTFRGSINYLQYNQLACSMASNFIIPYNRVYTQAMSYCGNTPYTFYPSNTSVILNQPDSNGWYIYGFYIEPDFTLASDATNTNIRNQLSISTSATTIITSTSNYINLPSLVQMQTYDIQIYTTPVMAISSPVSGLTSIVISAAITNMNGFIVIGVMNQTFNASVMTVPSVTNIKQGIFSTNISLTSVQMIHTTQNYNTTFQFTGLASNTLYTIFYFSTVEDPSITSLSSTVSYTTAQTLQMLTININWAPQLVALLLPMLALFLL